MCERNFLNLIRLSDDILLPNGAKDMALIGNIHFADREVQILVKAAWTNHE